MCKEKSEAAKKPALDFLSYTWEERLAEKSAVTAFFLHLVVVYDGRGKEIRGN